MLKCFVNGQANPLSHLTATHPKNTPVTPLFATLTVLLNLNSFICHTYKRCPGGPSNGDPSFNDLCFRHPPRLEPPRVSPGRRRPRTRQRSALSKTFCAVRRSSERPQSHCHHLRRRRARSGNLCSRG